MEMGKCQEILSLRKREHSMEILVVGGTKYFGIPMVQKLIQQGHKITLATRQTTQDCFGGHVERVKIERTNPASLKNAFSGRTFDVVIDKLYCRPPGFTVVSPGKYLAGGLQSGLTANLTGAQYRLLL